MSFTLADKLCPESRLIASNTVDPVVRQKVEMTKNTEDLLVHIPKHHLVKQLGGSSDWTWEYKPVVPGENAPQKYVNYILLLKPLR